MIRFYHNPRCKKSRAGLKYLQEKGVSFEVVEYLKRPLTVKEIEKLLVKLNIGPEEFIRTQEEYYKKNLRGRRFNDHEWIRVLADQPHLMRRPVVEREYKAVIGDPVENIDLIVT